jgi:hypothetical protein
MPAPLATADRYVEIFRAVEEGLLTIGDVAEAGQIGALKEIAAKARQA